jgi:hypothetical protein
MRLITASQNITTSLVDGARFLQKSVLDLTLSFTDLILVFSKEILEFDVQPVWYFKIVDYILNPKWF